MLRITWSERTYICVIIDREIAGRRAFEITPTTRGIVSRKSHMPTYTNYLLMADFMNGANDHVSRAKLEER